MKLTIGLNYDCICHWTLAAKKAGLDVRWHYQPNIANPKEPDTTVEKIALANFPHIPFKIPEDSIPTQYGEDIIAGSPPCIGYSQANPIASPDHWANRNTLEFFKMVEHRQPKMFMMEIIPQIQTRAPAVFKKALSLAPSFSKAYNVFNLEEYGSPSRRARLYILGIQSYRHTPAEVWEILTSLPKHKSKGAGPAIDDLKSKYAGLVRHANGRDIMSRWNKDGSMRRGEYSCIAKNPKNRTLSFNKPSPTITGASCDTILHYSSKEHGQLRFLGVLESSRLMGFPDTFNFNPTHRRLQARQYSKLIASGVQIDFTARLLKHCVEAVF